MRFKGTSLFNPTIIFIAALAYLSAGFTPGGSWKIYRNQHLGFSLKFPGDLNAEEFPDGLMVVNDKLPGIDRNIIQVTNAAFSQPNSNDRGAEYFNLFRNARPGSVLRQADLGGGTFRKVENLTVDGYPAVKMIYDNPASDRSQHPDWVGRDLPPSYDMHVYIRKGEATWAIRSFASDKKTQDERTKTFEQIISTFKFS